MSGWTKRESATNLTVLGDEQGQVRKTGGLLAGIEHDRGYDKDNYRIIKQSGEEIVLSGSANLARQLSPSDVGKFIRCEFKGWGRSANGKYKMIDVMVFDGTVTPEMQQWPRYAEVQASLKAAPAKQPERTKQATPEPEPPESFDDFPAALADEDDDLPF